MGVRRTIADFEFEGLSIEDWGLKQGCQVSGVRRRAVEGVESVESVKIVEGVETVLFRDQRSEVRGQKDRGHP